MHHAYIDWYLEKTKGKQVKVEIIEAEAIHWKDLVTGTQYFIQKEKYHQILETGCQQLKQYFEEEKLEEIEKIIYQPEKQEGDLSLFSLLPYQNETLISSVRICDVVCLRTAYLYACQYDSLIKKTNRKSEIKKLRLFGLTWNYGTKEPIYPELKWIEKMLFQKSEMPIETECKVDVVKGGMIKIKQYYLETNSIPEIRGASLLLDHVNDTKMMEEISKEYIRECLIYAGGGKMLGIFPSDCGKEICRNLEHLVEKTTVTAQSNFCSMTYSMKELTGQYKKIMEEMDIALEERQGLRWDYRIEPKVECTTMLTEKKRLYSELPKEKSPICDSCRHRFATAQLTKQPNPKVCQSCLHKNLYGGKDAKNSMSQKYQTYIRKKYETEIEDKEERFNTIKDIAGSSGFIGVIYGDANNMSQAIGQVDSLLEMQYFSEMAADTVTGVVFDSLYKHLGKMPSFEVIAVGGDDIFILVPGEMAYDIACAIGKYFDARFSNQSSDTVNMTMSLGVCITHDNIPVQFSFAVAQELLKSAKKKAWEEKQANNITGTIDWMVIENDSSGSSDLTYIRETIKGKSERTLRPYTWIEAGAMKEFISNIRDEKSLAFQFRQSWYQHVEKEAELFYEYQISGGKKKAVSMAMEKLADALGGQSISGKISLGDKTYTPWLDVIELWDYVKEVPHA